MKDEPIHIGRIIEKYLRENKISKVEFARRLPCHRTHIYDILKSQSLHLQQVQRICDVLNHNFFDDISKEMQKM